MYHRFFNSGFPDCLQADICLHLNRNLLTDCPAFKGLYALCYLISSIEYIHSFTKHQNSPHLLLKQPKTLARCFR